MHSFLKKVLICLPISCALILFLAAALAFYFSRDLPSLEQLERIRPKLATLVYSSDGQVLKEFAVEKRIPLPYEAIPQAMIDAVISIEDRRFYSHWGIDLRRTLKAAYVDLRHFGIVEGASTLTQQLARNLFLTMRVMWSRKIKEALTAIRIERTYSKQEILEMYMNQVYFRHGAYGIQSAAQTYFGKNVDELRLDEYALLAAQLKGRGYSPFVYPEGALRRRNLVLRVMANCGKISEEEAREAQSRPLGVRPKREEGGKAPYFTEYIRRRLKEDPRYGTEAIYERGLTIYTTLNYGLQKIAEEVLHKKLAELQAPIDERIAQIEAAAAAQARIDSLHRDLGQPVSHALSDSLYALADSLRKTHIVQGAFVALDPHTGRILAMVGGRDFKESEFNRAIQALRQPGSVFKPFVYTAAIDNGYRTTDIIFDTAISVPMPDGTLWRPENYDLKFLGPITLREGMKKSRNLVTIRLLMKISPEQAVQYARKMGITTRIAPVYSLAVGSCEVTLFDLTSAFCVFPNGGVHVEPFSILRIVDRDGRMLEERSQGAENEVLSAETAAIMTSMLQSVMEKGGTGYGARTRYGFKRPAGGKTGTTGNFADTWYIGFTPQIAAGVWIGFDEKISLGKRKSGAAVALPVWAHFMKAAHDSLHLPVADFVIPATVVQLDICAETHKIATEYCPRVLHELFKPGTEPTEICPKHRLTPEVRPLLQDEKNLKRGTLEF
ncbi:MAG: PBP1A family penicillin-binding protein [Candidatus Latescibacteria bacterium]|nr:PBP1A family penicillin-binding protein [Candidatus Latescibacterota bacterium]